ncbi:MAG: DUF58 domain-containing protein [Clostridia bacterium]|nr:DUF58 domain-containing protein [Clostridia bacterium]MBR2797600.1 DUF58 domain-containing protein [Clostridia bacterium]
MTLLCPRLAGYALVMLAMLAAGLSTGTRLYYLVFYALLAMLLLGFVAVLWTLVTLRVTLKGVATRVERGERIPAVFTVRHACPLPVAAIRVRLSVPSAYAPNQEVNVSCPPFARRTFRQVIECPHRGVYEVGVARLSVTDAFGLVTLGRRPGLRLVRLEVVPKARAASPLRLNSADQGPRVIRRAAEDNASPSDVRAWQEGDELKKVHWKLSLRKRELLVRTYEETARPDTLVIPDLQQVTALRDMQLTLEDCVCEAALGAAQAQLRAGDPVRMPLVGARPSEIAGQFPADLPAFADAMLRCAFDSPYGFEQVLTLMLGRFQRTGGAVLVTARLTTRIADIALRMQQSGVATRLVWVSDDDREESMAMIERLKMGGVMAERLDPWTLE